MARFGSRRSCPERTVVLAAGIVACTSSPSGSGPPGDVAAAGRERAATERDGDRPAYAPPRRDPEDLSPTYEVVRKVCSAPCAGSLARVTVYRDEAGAVGRLRFDGDLQACSHPPQFWFDPKGEQTLVVPEEPVVPGSPEAKAFADSQAAQMAGLQEAETFGCPDPERCAPARIEGFRSEFPCRTDEDCLACQCQPVDRVEWERRGGAPACTLPGEECTATNGACCGGRCALAR